MDIFCKINKGELPSYTCYENDKVRCIMDVNPTRPGHTLIIPKEHYTTVLDMDDDIIVEVHKASKIVMNKMLEKFSNIKSIKISVNYGEAQEIKHYHMHVIPCYNGEVPSLTQEEYCAILKD